MALTSLSMETGYQDNREHLCILIVRVSFPSHKDGEEFSRRDTEWTSRPILAMSELPLHIGYEDTQGHACIQDERCFDSYYWIREMDKLRVVRLHRRIMELNNCKNANET